jgi:hypothetical protein
MTSQDIVPLTSPLFKNPASFGFFHSLDIWAIACTAITKPRTQKQKPIISIEGCLPSRTIDDLVPGTYFFTVTARDAFDRESAHSNEVSTTLE